MPGVLDRHRGRSRRCKHQEYAGRREWHRDGTPTPRPPRRPLPPTGCVMLANRSSMVVAGNTEEAGEGRSVDLRRHRCASGGDITPALQAAPNAPQLHADAPGNVCLDFRLRTASRSRYIRTATSSRNCRCVTTGLSRLPLNRCSAIGETDPATDRLILGLSCQGVFGQRNLFRRHSQRAS